MSHEYLARKSIKGVCPPLSQLWCARPRGGFRQTPGCNTALHFPNPAEEASVGIPVRQSTLSHSDDCDHHASITTLLGGTPRIPSVIRKILLPPFLIVRKIRSVALRPSSAPFEAFRDGKRSRARLDPRSCLQGAFPFVPHRSRSSAPRPVHAYSPILRS